MKKQRLKEIRSIVREMEIENQHTLIEELRKRGFYVTQATVSRDINELKLEKALSDEGVNRYSLPSHTKTAKLPGFFSQAVKHIDYALNTAVVKCSPGTAGAVCAILDSMGNPSIVGTIAGDDTIFVLTRSERDASDLTEKLKKYSML